MTIMTITDCLSGDLINWDTTDTHLLYALGDLIPTDDERIRDTVRRLEEDARGEQIDSAQRVAATFGLRIQERCLALSWVRVDFTLQVMIDEWDPFTEEWVTPVDDALANLSEPLLPGDDWEDDAPYTAAEDRLLAAIGLTRDDISETIPCW